MINFALTTAALRHSTGRPHPEFFVISNILYASSGWINVLLWSLTGRQFGFTSESTKPDKEAADDEELSIPLASSRRFSDTPGSRTSYHDNLNDTTRSARSSLQPSMSSSARIHESDSRYSAAGTASPSSAPYDLPRFPSDQETNNEHSEYSRTLPDYGGEEFWAKERWNLDPHV